jgi:hypothetical protein
MSNSLFCANHCRVPSPLLSNDLGQGHPHCCHRAQKHDPGLVYDGQGWGAHHKPWQKRHRHFRRLGLGQGNPHCRPQAPKHNPNRVYDGQGWGALRNFRQKWPFRNILNCLGQGNPQPQCSPQAAQNRTNAVIVATDLHEAPNSLKALSQASSSTPNATVALNGDIVGPPHGGCSNEPTEFLNRLHALFHGRLIFNFGNYDFRFLDVLKASRITKFLNSNLAFNTSTPNGRSLSQIVSRYIIEDGTLYLGYCTTDVYKKSFCQTPANIGRQHVTIPYSARELLEIPAAADFCGAVTGSGLRLLGQAIQDAVRKGGFSRVVWLSHAGIDETRDVLNALETHGFLRLLAVQEKFVAIGHHHNSRLAQNRGQTICGFSVVAPRAFGQDVAVVPGSSQGSNQANSYDNVHYCS